MNNRFLFVICSLASLLFSACTYSTFYVSNDRLVYPPRNPSSVVISTQKIVRQNHKVLGRVAAISWDDGEGARWALQKEAAKIGANMVLDLRIERGFWKTSVSGLAVVVYADEEGS